jgi:dihydroflavonol-4-reductase
LGSNLVVALRAQGVDVRALFRSEASIAHLRGHPGAAGTVYVKGDLDDDDGLASAFADVDAVFHVAAMVSILPSVTPALTHANVDGTRRVMDAAVKAKARRVIHVSSTVAVGLAEDGGPDADEDSPWNLVEAGLADGYSITKRDAEAVAFSRAGDIDVVVVNPGYLFGPMDSKPSSGKLILDAARGRLPGLTPGVNSFVDVRDVVAGAIAAWQKGIAGERYILGGHNLPYTTLLPLMCARAGRAPPKLHVPRLIAAAIGAGGDLSYRVTGKEPLLTSAAIRWAFCTRFRVSSKKAATALGYRISPIEGAIDDALDWFRRTGRLR